MTKLAALRAQRARREAEIAAPYERSVTEAFEREERAIKLQQIAWNAHDRLQKVWAGDIATRLNDEITYRLTEAARAVISKAVLEAGKPTKAGFFTLKIHVSEMQDINPDSMVNTVLKHWAAQSATRLSLSVENSVLTELKSKTQVVRVTVPKLEYAQAFLS